MPDGAQASSQPGRPRSEAACGHVGDHERLGPGRRTPAAATAPAAAPGCRGRPAASRSPPALPDRRAGRGLAPAAAGGGQPQPDPGRRDHVAAGGDQQRPLPDRARPPPPRRRRGRPVGPRHWPHWTMTGPVRTRRRSAPRPPAGSTRRRTPASALPPPRPAPGSPRPAAAGTARAAATTASSRYPDDDQPARRQPVGQRAEQRAADDLGHEADAERDRGQQRRPGRGRTRAPTAPGSAACPPRSPATG